MILHTGIIPAHTRLAARPGDTGRPQRLLSAAILTALSLMASDTRAQRPIIYKCTQADGGTEYSSVPCGPDEQPDYITGESFSIVGRDPAEQQSGITPPLSPWAIRRQRAMQRDAQQRPASR